MIGWASRHHSPSPPFIFMARLPPCSGAPPMVGTTAAMSPPHACYSFSPIEPPCSHHVFSFASLHRKSLFLDVFHWVQLFPCARLPPLWCFLSYSSSLHGVAWSFPHDSTLLPCTTTSSSSFSFMRTPPLPMHNAISLNAFLYFCRVFIGGGGERLRAKVWALSGGVAKGSDPLSSMAWKGHVTLPSSSSFFLLVKLLKFPFSPLISQSPHHYLKFQFFGKIGGI